MVQGYHPVIEALSKDIDIRLNHRYDWGFLWKCEVCHIVCCFYCLSCCWLITLQSEDKSPPFLQHSSTATPFFQVMRQSDTQHMHPQKGRQLNNGRKFPGRVPSAGNVAFLFVFYCFSNHFIIHDGLPASIRVD